MENNNKLITHNEDIWKKASDHISSYIDIRKDIIDNPYVELLGDSIKIISFAKKTTTLIMQKRFESFLKGFNPETIPLEQQINRLIEFINDEAKAEFVSDTFAKILLSRSNKACLILGTLLHSIVNNKHDLTHDQLICFNSLSNFFDIDIENFKVSYEFILNKNTKWKAAILDSRMFKELCNSKSIIMSSMWLSVEKAVVNQIYTKFNELDLSIDDDNPSSSSGEIDEYYKITPSGELLYQYIKRCGM